jgi:SEC-C motif-containing protein
MLCYCKSNKEFDKCCGPFINGLQHPSVPLELMRSRYSAYSIGNLDYIQKTQREKFNNTDISFLKDWSKNSHWQHLEIVDSGDDFVEFKAFYIFNKVQHVMHEKSYFVKKDEKWIYDSGQSKEEKVLFGRNDPCICQSGKKYKKCCMKFL